MKASNFQLNDYLKRIGLERAPEVSAAGLAQLMRAQLRAVPFENLDIQAGKIGSMVPEDFVDKIVYRRRGGWCYEVNGLLGIALEALGFDYRLIGARPMIYPARRPKLHMALLVTVDDDRWACDTGFGSFGMRAPMSLRRAGQEITHDGETHMLEHTHNDEYVLKAKVKGEWANQYGFDLYPMEFVDFEHASFFNSKHPDSVLVQRYLIMQQTDQGRVLLSGDQLKHLRAGSETVTQVPPESLDEVLWREFKLRRP